MMQKMSLAATKKAFAEGKYDWGAARNIGLASVAVMLMFVSQFVALPADQLALLPAGFVSAAKAALPYLTLLASLVGICRAAQSLPPIVPEQ